MQRSPIAWRCLETSAGSYQRNLPITVRKDTRQFSRSRRENSLRDLRGYRITRFMRRRHGIRTRPVDLQTRTEPWNIPQQPNMTRRWTKWGGKKSERAVISLACQCTRNNVLFCQFRQRPVHRGVYFRVAASRLRNSEFDEMKNSCPSREFQPRDISARVLYNEAWSHLGLCKLLVIARATVIVDPSTWILDREFGHYHPEWISGKKSFGKSGNMYFIRTRRRWFISKLFLILPMNGDSTGSKNSRLTPCDPRILWNKNSKISRIEKITG